MNPLRTLPLIAALAGALLALTAGHANAAPPEGGRLAYLSGNADSQIFSVAPDGSDVTQLTAEPGDTFGSPSWSPGGQRLVYSRQEEGGDGRSRLWTMKADGSDARPLTGEHTNFSTPAWSPDGRRIAFWGTPQSFKNTHLGIYTIKPDGTGLKLVVADTRLHRHLDPTWSPDSRQLAYVDVRNVDYPDPKFDNGTLYRVRADGRHRVRLTDDTAVVRDPAWSPGGAKIAFVSSPRPLKAFRLHTISWTGKGLRAVGGHGGVVAYDVAWSSSGKLVYPEDRSLRLVAPDGMGLGTIVTSPGPQLFEPAWSRPAR